MSMWKIRKKFGDNYKYVKYFIRKGLLPNGEPSFQVEYTDNISKGMIFTDIEMNHLPDNLGEKVLIK